MTQSRAEQPRNQMGLAQIWSKLKASKNDIQNSLLLTTRGMEFQGKTPHIKSLIFAPEL